MRRADQEVFGAVVGQECAGILRQDWDKGQEGHFHRPDGVRRQRQMFRGATERVCPAAFCCDDLTLTSVPAQHVQKSKGSWLGEGKEPWLQLWDARDLRKLLHDFGDEWCRQSLALRPQATGWNSRSGVKGSPSRGQGVSGGGAANRGKEMVVMAAVEPRLMRDKAHGAGRQYQLVQPALSQDKAETVSQDKAETVSDGIGKENEKSNPCRPGCAVRGDATASGPAKMKMGSGGKYACEWVGGPSACRPPSCEHSNSGRACVGEDGGIGQAAGDSGPLSTPVGHFDGRNGERSSKKIKFDVEEDFQIYCYLRKELAPHEGPGHQTELPDSIKSSKVLQGLLDRCPGSRSSRNMRSERTLRNRVNESILKNEARRREFDAEYKKRGTLTFDEMMRGYID